MYAVIETGGKQYRVAVGDVVEVEKLNLNPGDTIDLDRVLMVQDGEQTRVGAPVLKETVSAKVVEHGRGKKLRIFKMRRRKHYRKMAGHRQDYTALEIMSIGSKA